ncbi:uncharacterized protein LOC125940168 [Dermacentor silvarum]|uniref:uncharacterized protein LOC125940168 n=1 Tax=Dermacentor silvarum TaxID=543639 RepID=UPI002100D474|nr:uncharacterized protein LOC125940168 [Dermacentor silvarum]
MADDDDDDSDEKSSMSTMSTAGGKGKKAAAGGGGSGLGLCLCLVGVLGVCAAGAVAAFLLLDDGGGANKTDNASEAASAAASGATSAASAPVSSTTVAKPEGARGATEDAPQLDAYGRFAQEEDKPLKTAVVSRQREHRKSSRRRSRVRLANGAVVRQSSQHQGTERTSGKRAKRTAATRRSTRRSAREARLLASNGVRLHRKRQHPANAPSAGAAAHRIANLRADTDKRRSVASSHEVSVTSAGSRRNASGTTRALTSKNATRRAVTAGANRNTTDRSKEKASAAAAGSHEVSVISAGSRVNELARTRVPASQDTTRSASTPDANRRIAGSSKASRAAVKSDEVSANTAGSRVNASERIPVATSEDTKRNAGAPDANQSMTGSSKASRAVVRSDKVSDITSGGHVSSSARTRVATSENVMWSADTAVANRRTTGTSKASAAVVKSDEVPAISYSSRVNASARTRDVPRENAKLSAGTADASALKEKASHRSLGGTSISAASGDGRAVRTENEFSRGGAPASLSVHAQ